MCFTSFSRQPFLPRPPSTQPWCSDDGTLTASLKIVPKKIQMAHSAELAAAKAKGIR